MAKYLMRFDDVNSRMDWEKFLILKRHLEKHNIKSILGVVPNCKDEFLFSAKPNKHFFDYLRKCKLYGDSIAQHGYEHRYDSKSRGIYGTSSNSEFAGHPYEIQFNKLNNGKKILEKELIWEPIFMAPGHSFDKGTIIALKKLGFSKILDGLSFNPYTINNLIFIPQFSSKPLPIFFPCISQLCVHINTISTKEIKTLMKFISKHHKKFISVNEIRIYRNKKYPLDGTLIKIISTTYRNIKKIPRFTLRKYLLVLCLLQRIYYKLKFHNFDIDNWHLQGTFYCRKYKILSLKIINDLKPQLYIDIGCGLGEILSKVKLSKFYKLGYDSDTRINKVNIKKNNSKFQYFNKEEKLFEYAKKIQFKEENLVVISMLNFVHNLSLEELQAMIAKYYKEVGEYILLIDNIYKKEKEYKYSHHNFLLNHSGLIKHIHKVDKLRSLYYLKIKE